MTVEGSFITEAHVVARAGPEHTLATGSYWASLPVHSPASAPTID